LALFVVRERRKAFAEDQAGGGTREPGYEFRDHLEYA
jgi:hypothetical protein